MVHKHKRKFCFWLRKKKSLPQYKDTCMSGGHMEKSHGDASWPNWEGISKLWLVRADHKVHSCNWELNLPFIKDVWKCEITCFHGKSWHKITRRVYIEWQKQNKTKQTKQSKLSSTDMLTGQSKVGNSSEWFSPQVILACVELKVNSYQYSSLSCVCGHSSEKLTKQIQTVLCTVVNPRDREGSESRGQAECSVSLFAFNLSHACIPGWVLSFLS